MAFTDLDETYPRGTQKVSILDDEQRNTRAWIKNNLPLISGYPDLETSKVMTYATADRPTTTKEGLLGYNTTTGAIEVSNNNGSFTSIDGGIAIGFITMFSGSFDSSGHPINPKTNSAITSWALCNGANGTPDLRGRFVLGAGGSYSAGAQGGTKEEVLSVAQMPQHKHDVTIDRTSLTGGMRVRTQSADSWGIVGISENGLFSDGNADDNHLDVRMTIDASHGHTGSISYSGGNQAHNNMPPYYALAFIMKIS